MTLLAITRQTGMRLAEIGFLLAAIAGALLLIAQFVPSQRRVGLGLSGAALAGGAVLLIIATHWGRFG
jgi:hypothetical protein